MICPNGCDFTMYEIDDCGDGTQGHECGMCGAVVSDRWIPCPEGDGEEPCFPVDDRYGRPVCGACERDM